MGSVNRAFQEIGRVHTDRSAFDLSHYNTTTMDMGILYPVANLFCMPGDKYVIDIVSMMRAQPLVYPAYVDIDINFHAYFVPSRLLDDNFEEFITGGEDGTYSQPIPKITFKADDNAGLAFKDHLLTRLRLLPFIDNLKLDSAKSIYDKIPNDLKPTSLPVRAYYFIWNEFYRDQNLQDKIDFKTIDSWHNGQSDGLLRVAWLKDYFTSALPFQQRGTAPAIPFEATIDSSKLPNSSIIGTVGNNVGKPLSEFAGYNISDPYIPTNLDKDKKINVAIFDKNIGNLGDVFSSNDTKAFLDKLTVNINDTFTISELRTAFQVQKFLERNARAGVRYTEFLQAHFNTSLVMLGLIDLNLLVVLNFHLLYLMLCKQVLLIVFLRLDHMLDGGGR